MKLRIIQLEDSVMKHSAISRVIKNAFSKVRNFINQCRLKLIGLQICIIHCPQAVRLTGRWEIYLLIL